MDLMVYEKRQKDWKFCVYVCVCVGGLPISVTLTTFSALFLKTEKATEILKAGIFLRCSLNIWTNKQ